MKRIIIEFIVKSYTVDARVCIQTWNSKKSVGTRIREVSALRLVRHDYTQRRFFLSRLFVALACVTLTSLFVIGLSCTFQLKCHASL